MTKIIAISNHKGGVGKTTSTTNIGAGLALEGYKILLVDLDPQANLTQTFGIEEPEQNIYGALKGEYLPTPIKLKKNISIIPSVLDLSGAEIELSSEAGREFILRELINNYNNFDYIIIDCPPSLGLLTINALTAADDVYIPLQAHYLSLQGLNKITEVVNKVKKRLNSKLKISGVFITQFDQRKILNREVAELIEEYFPTEIFYTKIRDNIALAEAPTESKDIFEYSPKSNGAYDYGKLCREIIKRFKKLK